MTRDADIPIEEGEAEDLLEALELGLRWRQRASSAVRLEIAADAIRIGVIGCGGQGTGHVHSLVKVQRRG